MRILLIAENWPPRVGGIENYLTHIAGHLPPKSVTVVAPSGSTQISAPGIEKIGTNKFFWPLIRPKWLPLYISLHRQAKQQSWDVVFCGKALFEGLIGYYLKKSFGIPYVVFSYAMEIETWGNDPSERRKLGRVLKNADRVVYINEVTKKSLVDLGVQEKQLVKIWPGVDDKYFVHVDEAASQRTLEKYKLKKLYVLCVSRLIERKGIDVLIEAFRTLDQTRFSQERLAIVGDGPEREKLEKLAAGESRIIFLGAVPDEDLPVLYTNAELFALTPRRVEDDMEGFGIVYLEAAASGVPAIATQTGGAPEAVIHKQTGIVVQPNSLPAVTEALEYLLHNPDKRKKLGEQAKQRAYDEFRWSKRIMLVKAMLDAILAEQRMRS